ncbi:lysylphosphatidylglycerol synthase transmembrane domain-containing protein [Listeria ivanovii]|uniref:Phosphatidylglycerol lysyltransferase n=1 Tax=Listeria ivanovii (strain ATCC BAA-678 / PAM 55) TaxID=881621 RepID=G2ZFR6_LISIP|nr:lysylphosphatidylglycerol synthase transmembrane domain-containing protein [Listeria ivanovii]AHI56981.1 membrane protein [Listeria ivanovii WSLC3009]AIS66397.1 membrane protein [Listeria ivanovii subsp. ivanovii]MBC1759802.1 flippase-like domain-containing protein [Listeria ivanovii]MCJ1723282.1 flippase-like domain-containing protein [Listeria ivanovii]MCJ1735850.1 flippase-like domain-containing protein [Listeria ivanovii]
MSGSSKKNIFNIVIVLAISIGFIIWQFKDVDMKWSTFLISLLKVNPWWMMAALGAMFIYWFLEAVVLQTASKPANQNQRFFSSFRITMIGQFFNTITPMATGGQPAQLVMLTKQGMDAGRGSSVLLVKFIIYQAMVVLNFIVILIFGIHYLMAGVTQLKYLVLIGFSVHLLVIACLILIGRSQKFTTSLVHILLIPTRLFVKKEKVDNWRKILDEKIATFHEESSRIGKDWKLIIRCCLYTTLQLWVYFSIPFFILHAIGVTGIGLYMAITYHAFIIMFATVMPTPGGAGGAEYTFTLLFGMLLGPAKLLMALILWRIITYYNCIIFGAGALLVKDTSPKEIKPRIEAIAKIPAKNVPQ